MVSSVLSVNIMLAPIMVGTATICCKTVEVVWGPQAWEEGRGPQLNGINGKFTMDPHLHEGKVRYVSENGSKTIALGWTPGFIGLPGFGNLAWQIKTELYQ